MNQRRRRSTIGLDYGTHSTKVVHRVRNEELGSVVSFDDPCPGYSASVSPSVIREVDGKLYFGSIAVKMNGGVEHRSLKAKLLKLPEDPNERQHIEVLTSAYLAWALNRIYETDERIRDDRPIIQISAPIAHVGSEDVLLMYERMANASYLLVTEGLINIDQGFELENLKRILVPLLEAEVPAPSERKFFVLPETVAPIVSLQLEPFLSPGIYLIADMGAATTEMSVLAVNDAKSESSVLAYYDDTALRGGNDLDSIQKISEETRSKAMLKEFLVATRKQSNRVWYLGFQKDFRCQAARDRWESLQILLTGGATLSKPVSELFYEDVRPGELIFGDSARTFVDRHNPKTLECDDENGELSLFAVANGLSIERPRWPRFFNEDEIPALEADEPEVDSFDLPYYLQCT